LQGGPTTTCSNGMSIICENGNDRATEINNSDIGNAETHHKTIPSCYHFNEIAVAYPSNIRA